MVGKVTKHERCACRKKGEARVGARLSYTGIATYEAMQPYASGFLMLKARAGAPGFPPHEPHTFSVPDMSLEDLTRSKGKVS